MGASKVPFYIYVDESGNTGKNIFDAAQPDYFTASVISKGDFDALYNQQIRIIASKLGAVAVHANEFGLGKLELIAEDLFLLIQRSGVMFFVSRVEKKYLLATKIFDVLFDSGENAAVAWHNYNFRPLKSILAFKLGHIIDESIARDFWKCLLMPREADARKMLPLICNSLKSRLSRLPDQRSRDVLGEGLDWIIKHPECVQFATEQQIAKKGHFPNLVAFVNLLDGLQGLSLKFKRRVACITHDEQSEFGRSLRSTHSLLVNASPDEIEWFGARYSVQKVPGSRFEMKRDQDSVGIQMADVALWLYGQFLKGKEIPQNCGRLLELILQRGWHNDFSFSGVEEQLLASYGDVLFGPMEPEQLEAGKRMVIMGEERRRVSMEQYEADSLPPFMRPITVTEKPRNES